MSRIILVFSLLLTCLSFAQVTRITYRLEIPVDETVAADYSTEIKRREMKDVFKYTDFELLFDQKQSKFYSPEIMESDKLPFLEAASYLSINKPVYADAAYRYVYGEAGLGIDEQYLVKISMYQWVVQPETKTIAGYKCNKATYSRPGAEGVTHTAWFCPEIKSRFGPIGMGNLPGTILQVEQGGMVFTTTKVELKVKEKIEFPKNVKIITEKEYINLWDEWERKEMGAPQGN